MVQSSSACSCGGSRPNCGWNASQSWHLDSTWSTSDWQSYSGDESPGSFIGQMVQILRFTFESRREISFTYDRKVAQLGWSRSYWSCRSNHSFVWPQLFLIKLILTKLTSVTIHSWLQRKRLLQPLLPGTPSCWSHLSSHPSQAYFLAKSSKTPDVKLFQPLPYFSSNSFSPWWRV